MCLNCFIGFCNFPNIPLPLQKYLLLFQKSFARLKWCAFSIYQIDPNCSTYIGLSHPDQIPGPAIPFGSKTRAVLSFRNKIPGWGYPFRLNTRTGLPPSDEIPGRCYLLETKYQNGVTPFRSNTRKLLSFRGKIPGWDDPLQN